MAKNLYEEVQNAKKEYKKKQKRNNIIAASVAGALIASGITVGTIMHTSKTKTPESSPRKNIKEDVTYVTKAEEKEVKIPGQTEVYSESEISVKKYGGTNYYMMSEDFAVKIAGESMARVEQMLKENVPNIAPLAPGDDTFYPDYYDAYMLAGLSMTESDFRICTEDGTPLTSNVGALGPMQIKPETVDYVNYWVKDVMGIKGVQYTINDLTDPEKSMDIANLYLISCAKNYTRDNCNNPIFKKMGVDFSKTRQQQILIAMYNEGPGNMLNHAEDGSIYSYLKEGPKTNYLNKVLTKTEQIRVNQQEMF